MEARHKLSSFKYFYSLRIHSQYGNTGDTCDKIRCLGSLEHCTSTMPSTKYVYVYARYIAIWPSADDEIPTGGIRQNMMHSFLHFAPLQVQIFWQTTAVLAYALEPPYQPYNQFTDLPEMDIVDHSGNILTPFFVQQSIEVRKFTLLGSE